MSADGFWLTDSGWDETGPRTRARARPSRVGEGCRARISGLSAGVAHQRGGGELSSVAALVAMVTSISWCDR